MRTTRVFQLSVAAPVPEITSRTFYGQSDNVSQLTAVVLSGSNEHVSVPGPPSMRS
jgi:hypothetical protein